MADTTIINTPASQDDSGAGWVVALIILIAVIVGGFLWYRYYGHAASTSPSGTNINVTIPTPSTGGTAGSKTY